MLLEPTTPPVAGLLTSVPFVAVLALFLASLGMVIVVISLIVGLTKLRKIGSLFVVGGSIAYLLLF